MKIRISGSSTSNKSSMNLHYQNPLSAVRALQKRPLSSVTRAQQSILKLKSNEPYLSQRTFQSTTKILTFK